MGDPATPLDMTRELVRRLAALSGATTGGIEAAIALWELGDRLSLAAHGIIDTTPDEALDRQGMPTDFTVTSYGSEIIDECAEWQQHAETAPLPAALAS